MKSSWLALVCVFAAAIAVAQGQVSPAAVGVAAAKGKMLVAANGARLGPVYRVGVDGAAQVVVEGRLVNVPAATLSADNGRIKTSLSKSEVLALQ